MIPSYDDLTPPIPNVVSSETVPQLALFLRDLQAPAPPAARLRGQAAAPVTLYACLHQRGDATLEGGAGLLAVARDFSPRIMRIGAGEVVLDVSGLGRLIGEPAAVGAELARALRAAPVAAHVAIAPAQTTARLLAAAGAAGRTPAGAQSDPCVSIADDLASALTALPVQLLQPLEESEPGAPMNARDRARPYETFERWGIATLGELAALPAGELSSRLGRRGAALQRLARGIDPRPFLPDTDTPRFVERLELEWPIEGLEPLSFVLARLLDPLSVRLERADRGAAAVRLDLRLTDRSSHVRVLQLPAPMRDARVLRTLLLLDLESHPPSAAIDIVSVELDPAPARITQFSLLERALPSPETLSTLLARLAALVGEHRCGAAQLVDTHQPGAFRMQGFAPHASGTPKAPQAPGVPVLRRQRIPPAIRVRVERGRPVHLATTRRGMPSGAVREAAGPWRTSGGWWTDAGAERPGEHDTPWNRDEWDVALGSGVACRIFQDRATGRWFLDGTYD